MNTAKTAFLMIVLTGLFILIGYAIGKEAGMIIAFALAFLMNIFSYWFSDKIVLAMYRAQEVDEATAPGLYATVRRLIQRAGLPMPRVYIIPQAGPNAFATGRNPQHAAVAVTQGLLQILDDEELEGVIAHELSHVGNRDILIGTIAATLAGAIMILSRIGMYSGLFFGGSRDRRGGGIGVIFVAIFGTLAAILIQMAISRSREYQADASAAKLSRNPHGLSRALEALQRAQSRVPVQANPATSHMFIVNPFTRKGIAGLLSTHPPIEQRIQRLERIARDQ
ncbi:MAG: zinc metalloprotease HtpX [Armatimonadetes bacterium]|nr:zinc metalloprotease HtpX [Armatimonadota bacterium]